MSFSYYKYKTRQKRYMDICLWNLWIFWIVEDGVHELFVNGKRLFGRIEGGALTK